MSSTEQPVGVDLTAQGGAAASALNHALVVTRMIASGLLDLILQTKDEVLIARAYVMLKSAYALQNDGDLTGDARFAPRSDKIGADPGQEE